MPSNDPLAPITPGQDLPTSIRTWNPILDAARAYQQGKRPNVPTTGQAGASYVEALALNNTGAALPRYHPAAVTGAGGFDLSNDRVCSEWSKRAVVTLGVPTGAGDMIAVALEDIPDGKFGRVAVAGWVACFVDISNAGHQYASPGTDTEALVSGETGSIRIIPTDTGDAIRTAVYLGDQTGSSGGGGGNLQTRNQGETDYDDTTKLEAQTDTGVEFVPGVGSLPDKLQLIPHTSTQTGVVTTENQQSAGTKIFDGVWVTDKEVDLGTMDYVSPMVAIYASDTADIAYPAAVVRTSWGDTVSPGVRSVFREDKTGNTPVDDGDWPYHQEDIRAKSEGGVVGGAASGGWRLSRVEADPVMGGGAVTVWMGGKIITESVGIAVGTGPHIRGVQFTAFGSSAAARNFAPDIFLLHDEPYTDPYSDGYTYGAPWDAFNGSLTIWTGPRFYTYSRFGCRRTDETGAPITWDGKDEDVGISSTLALRFRGGVYAGSYNPESPPPPPPPPPAGTGTISGLVDSGPPDHDLAAGRTVTLDGLITTTTALDGTYTFSGVYAGIRAVTLVVTGGETTTHTVDGVGPDPGNYAFVNVPDGTSHTCDFTTDGGSSPPPSPPPAPPVPPIPVPPAPPVPPP